MSKGTFSDVEADNIFNTIDLTCTLLADSVYLVETMGLYDLPPFSMAFISLEDVLCIGMPNALC